MREAGFAVTTVQDLGWTAVSNGELLRRAEIRFDILLTNDKNLASQQNMGARKIAVAVLATNSRRVVLARSDAIVESLRDLQRGQVVTLH